MTQQYYDPNQGYAAPPQPPYQPQYPPQQGGYVPAPQGGYMPSPQGFVQAPYAPPPGYGMPNGQMAPPAPVGAQGGLEDFFGQPATGGGKGVSWKGVPDGFTIYTVVARPITDGDVFQESDPQTKALRTFRDGRPKFALQVPVRFLVPLPSHPDGDGRVFLRGQLRDEVTRAMAEAGAPEGAPESGAFMRITLTHRKPGNNIAQNIFAVLYRSPGTWEQDPNLLQQQIHATATAPSVPYNQGIPANYPPQQPAQSPGAGQVYGGAPQGPYQPQAQAQYAAPAQAAPNPQQYAQPQYGQQAYDPNQGQPSAFTQMAAAQGAIPDPAQMQATYAQNAQGQPAPNPQQYSQQGQPPATMQAPAGAVNAGGQAPLPGMPNPSQPPVQPGVQPSGLDPARAALLARVSGQQAQGQPQQPQG